MPVLHASIRLILPAALVTAFLPAIAAAGIIRLGSDVVPVLEEIHLRIDADADGYTGTVRAETTVNTPVRSFRISGRDLEITRVRITDDEGTIPGDAERSGRAEEEGVYTITAPRFLRPGPAAIAIDFTSAYDTHSVGLYRVVAGGKAYTFTQLEADDARRAFPCWDEPEFKIPFRLSIDVPEAHTAVTNTPVESETVADGWRQYVFAKTKPLPSYLIAIATGPLEYTDVPGTSIPTRIVTAAGQAHLAAAAVKVTPRGLAALERWFDEPYPYAKLDLIAAPEFWPGAMENPGAIVFADRVLLKDSPTPDANGLLRLSGVLAHELSHMWFGDVVTMKWWDDLWLNESFADWMGDKITEEVYPDLQCQLKELNDMQGTMIPDGRSTARPVHKDVADMNDLLSEVGVAYNKGKRVLSHFENWMGPETFRRGILDYIAAHRWGSAAADDLWKALGDASGKDVKAVMATFTDQPGYPLVSVDVLPEGKVRLSQRRFSEYGEELPPLSWRIPIGLRYSDGRTVRTQTVLLADTERVVDLDAPKGVAWVMPNANAGGYYRWTVTGDGLDRLTADARTDLTAAERIGLIGNLSGLLSAGVIDGPTFLESLARFSEDPEPLVISAIIENLNAVHTGLVPDDAKDGFSAYVYRTLGPSWRRFGPAPNPGESETVALLRPELMRWLGREGRDPEVLMYARSQAELYAQDPAKAVPGTVRICMELAALDGDRALFDRYKAGFEAASTPDEREIWLNGFSGFQDPALERAVLDYAITGPFRSNEIRELMRNINERGDREVVFDWIAANFDRLKDRIASAFVAFLPNVAAGCSTDLLDRTKAFFAAPEHRVDGTDRQIARTEAVVQACTSLRARQGAAVAAWLDRTN